MYGSGIDNVIKEIAIRLNKNNDIEINTFFCDRKDFKKVILHSNNKSKSVFTAYNPFAALKVIRSVKRYDAVMSQIYPMNLLVALGCFIYKKPHIAYFWGAPPGWMASSLFEKIYFKFLHLTELMMPAFVSKSLVPNGFIKKWNRNKKAIEFPMHGVDLKRFNIKKFNKKNAEKIKKKYGIPKDAKILFTLGRVTPYKGVDLLIKSLNIVRNKYPNTYLVVGGKPWTNDYIKYLKSLSDEHVVLVGLVEEENLVDYYGMCDIYVSASKWEGQLNAEALAMGKPYIAFDTTSHRHTLEDGKNGFLVKPYDVNEFGKKMITLFDKPKLMNSMGKEGLKWALEYSDYDKIADKLEKFFHEIK